MTKYSQFYNYLLEYTESDELQILGIVHRESSKQGQLDTLDVSYNDVINTEWRRLESNGNAITWGYVPAIQQLSFFTLIPTENELNAIKSFLKARGFTVKRLFVRKDRQKELGLNKKLKTENKKYCGVLLDIESQNKLKQLFGSFIPANWTIHCHHMTINPFNECTENIGNPVNLMVTHFGKDEKACAVKVVGYNGKTNNAFPHVTIAVNESAGGQAKDSNKIKDWIPIKQHIVLSGEIKNL